MAAGLVLPMCMFAPGRPGSSSRSSPLRTRRSPTDLAAEAIAAYVEADAWQVALVAKRLAAYQGGEAIFDLGASFCVDEPGIEHQAPMPEAPPPEGLPDWEDLRAQLAQGPPRVDSPIEVRMADPWSNQPSEPRQRSWMRVRGTLPDDRRVHEAMLVYATDRTLLGTAARPHGIAWQKRMNASLDHAVWIHHEVRLDGWVLYTSESPIGEM